jgi:hypothetical protein
MRVIAVLVALAVVGLAVWWFFGHTPHPPRKIAVLVSAEYAESNVVLYDADFWYDTVLTYCALRRNGFADEDIYVLYGHGEDGFYLPDGGTQPSGASVSTSTATSENYYMPPFCAGAAGDRWSRPITDFPMVYPATGTGKKKDGTASRPHELLECLASGCWAFMSEYGTIKRLDKRDFLYVWWKGHGFQSTSDPGSVSFTLPGLTSVTADEVVGWLAKVRAGRRVLVLETCHSGCIAGTINTVDPPGILFASAGCGETSSNSYRPVGDVPHGVWTYWVDCSLQGQMPNPPIFPWETAMSIGLSVGEPLDQVFDQSAKAVGRFTTRQTPLKKDECDLAPHTTIQVADPVGQTPVPCPRP